MFLQDFNNFDHVWQMDVKRSNYIYITRFLSVTAK